MSEEKATYDVCSRFVHRINVHFTCARCSSDKTAQSNERQLRLRQKIQAAMAYPIAVGLIAICVVVFLLTNVVPTFVEMFKQNNTELPQLTKMVIAASNWMVANWWIALSMIVFVYLNFLLILRRKHSRFYWDYAILKVPVV